MSRYNRVSRYMTKVERSADGTAGAVIYRGTPIVVWTAHNVVLQTGGWRSVTTKRKMNQASHEFGLGFGVSQKNYDWTVTTPRGDAIPFDSSSIAFAR